jgi:hypothetical protein
MSTLGITDEALMAYADGEGDIDATRAIEAALMGDPALRERLARMRSADADVRAAFDAIPQAPAPDRLMAALLAARASAEAKPDPEAHGATTPNTSTVTAFRPRRATGWVWPTALAACLVLGVGIGRMSLTPSSEPDWTTASGREAPRAGKVIAAALSGTPSGVSAALSEGRKITPVLTFVSQAGELCRQFSFIGPVDRHSGLACRQPQGDWALVALTVGEPVNAGSDYRTAAGPGDDPVSAMTDRLIKGEPLDAAGESAALTRAR